MYFPILFWGAEEKESLVQVVLWLKNILKGKQTCLSAAYKTWANSEVPVLLAPCLASSKPSVCQCCVRAQFPPLWQQKGVKSGVRVRVSQILGTEASHAACIQGRPRSLGLGPQSVDVAYAVLSRSREIHFICIYLCVPQALGWHVITGSFLLQLREEEGIWKAVLRRGSSASSKVWFIVSVLPW